MPTTYEQHVQAQIRDLVASELDSWAPERLLAADVEETAQSFFERIKLNPLPISSEVLRKSAAFDIHDKISNEVKVYLSNPAFPGFVQFLSLKPSSGPIPQLHMGGGQIWFHTPAADAESGLNQVLDGLQQIAEDVRAENPRLLVALRELASARIGMAQSGQAARDRELAALAASGIPRRATANTDGENGPTSQDVPSAAKLCAIRDPQHSAAAVEILDTIERNLLSLEDSGALTAEGSAMISKETIPLVQALRAVLTRTAANEADRQTLVRRGLHLSGRAAQSVLTIGRFVSGAAGIAKVPGLLKDADEALDNLAQWLN